MSVPLVSSPTPAAAIDIIEQIRRRFLVVPIIIALVTTGIGFVSQFIADGLLVGKIALGIAFLFSAAALFLLLRGRFEAAANLAIILFVGSAISSPMAIQVMGALALIGSATFNTRRVYILVNIIILSKAAADAVMAWPGLSPPMPDAAAERIIIFISLLVISFSTRFLVNQMSRATQAARRGTALLQSVAEIGQALSKLLDMDELLNTSVEMIRDRLGFYHVQVFLVDDSAETARLAASTGAVGRKLLERKHNLVVGSQSVIGQVTLVGRPVIARDTDPVYYRNELLPDTRAELAVPILDGDRIIGALDVQSRSVEAFDADRVQAIQVMANLLGTSIRNARLFEMQAHSAAETKRLYLETETSLREIQRLNQQLTREGWQDYLRGKRVSSGVTLEQDRLMDDTTWTDTLAQATRSRQPVTTRRPDGGSIIALPVVLGSEVLGAIEIETDRPMTQAETVEMMRAVSQRLAVSLDKARLFEESQEATAQEQRINDIVARYQTVTNVDDLLRITLTELSQSLGAARGAIRLSLEPEGDTAP